MIVVTRAACRDAVAHTVMPAKVGIHVFAINGNKTDVVADLRRHDDVATNSSTAERLSACTALTNHDS